MITRYSAGSLLADIYPPTQGVGGDWSGGQWAGALLLTLIVVLSAVGGLAQGFDAISNGDGATASIGLGVGAVATGILCFELPWLLRHGLLAVTVFVVLGTVAVSSLVWVASRGAPRGAVALVAAVALIVCAYDVQRRWDESGPLTTHYSPIVEPNNEWGR